MKECACCGVKLPTEDMTEESFNQWLCSNCVDNKCDQDNRPKAYCPVCGWDDIVRGTHRDGTCVPAKQFDQ